MARAEQITLDGYLTHELICCSATEHFHWLRISEGRTPEVFRDRVHFQLRGYDYLYENTSAKDEILSAFDGEIRHVTWEEATGNVH